MKFVKVALHDMILRLSLFAVAAFAAIAAVANAQLPSSTHIDVIDNAYTPSSTTIALNGTVSFSFDEGEESHNVHFDKAGPACTQNSGSTAGAVGRVLPKQSEGPGWSGVCQFPTSGVYTFYCDDHSDMTGKITVANADGTLPATPTPTPTATATPRPGATATPTPGGGSTNTGDNGGGGAPASNPATGPKVTIAGRQRGQVVTVKLTGGSERAKVAVEALARRADLKAKGKAKLVRVGRTSRTVAPGAQLSVKVALNAKAKAALKRLGKLKLTLKTTIARKTATRTVTLRKPAKARMAQKAVTVAVADNTFSPKTATVARGGTVTWRWKGKKGHNVVGPNFASKVIKTGTYKRKFTKKGTISYSCTLHRGMVGKIRVK